MIGVVSGFLAVACYSQVTIVSQLLGSTYRPLLVAMGRSWGMMLWRFWQAMIRWRSLALMIAKITEQAS
jgi:hypothetical protein